MSRSHWTSRLTFIITTSSFAIGLGNIWRFPYLVGANGGGAFLLVYLTLVFLVGIPILLTEVSLGRMAQTSPLKGFGELSGKKGWNAIGWIEVIAGLLIMSYYVMILAWVGIYFRESLAGNFAHLGTTAFPAHFDEITGNFLPVFLVAAAMTIGGSMVVQSGLKNGIEKGALYLMPALLVLVIVLGIWALTLEGAGKGVAWYLNTDFSRINFSTILAALGQLFFSIGVGFSTAFVFGSYSDRSEDIVASTGVVVLADTLVAFLAGFMIFPALFAFGMTPDAGPSLVFITMARLFSVLPMGQLFGALFFLLLIVAGFTSLIATIEGMTASFSERYAWSRKQALFLVSGMLLVLSVPNILSYSKSIFSGLWGKTYYEWMDWLTNVILLPLAGLLIILFSMYVIGFKRFQAETNEGAAYFRVASFWSVLAKIIIPAALLIILINGALESFRS